MRRRIVIATLALAFAGCRSKEQGKRYAIHGEVKALDPNRGIATIRHGKIGDWMEAMTMEFPVRPVAEFQKLRVGALIDATVVVGSEKYYVTDVHVAEPAVK